MRLAANCMKFIILIVSLSTLPLHAQKRTSIEGFVLNSETGKALYGCNVSVKGTLLGAATNTQGHFIIEGMGTGNYTLISSMIGYERHTLPITVEPGSIQIIEIRLTSAPIIGPAVIVTASKRQQPLESTPISVDVVRGKDIALRNVVSVDEVLANSAGIGVIDGQIDIRGSTGFNWTAGSRVLLLLDGHPLIGGDTGGINWDAIAPEEVEQIEVVKGAGSALYGSNAMAGVINIITKAPSTTPETRYKLTWGFFDKPAYDQWAWTDNFLMTQLADNNLSFSEALSTKGISLTHSRKIGRTGIRLHMTQRSSTGYQQNGDYSRLNLMAKSRTDLGKGRLLNISGGWSVNNHGDVLQWESLQAPLEVPANELGNNVRYEKMFINADFRQVLSETFGITAKVNGYHTFWENDFYDNNDQAKNYRLGAELQTDRIMGKHTLTSGIELITAGTNSDIYGDRSTWDGAVYAEDQWQPHPSLTLTMGARFDLHHVDSIGTDSQISPRIGAVYKTWQGGLWRFTAGRGFRAPSIAEIFAQIIVSGFKVIPNPNLDKAERALSLETGFHQMAGWPDLPLNPMIDLDAAIFYSRYDNMIDVQVADNESAIQFANIGAARIWGIETRLNTAFLNRKIETSLGYTWLSHSRIKNNDPLPYRPRHRANIGLAANWKGFFCGVDYRYASRAEAVANIYPNDPRVAMHVMDFRAGHSWNRYRISIEIKNLRNYHYTLRQRFMEPVRQFFITFEGLLGANATFN
ncbi:TonB-dependent receptor [bacterium]|nr:TonB-dependent receptor [bacterium]